MNILLSLPLSFFLLNLRCTIVFFNFVFFFFTLLIYCDPSVSACVWIKKIFKKYFCTYKFVYMYSIICTLSPSFSVCLSVCLSPTHMYDLIWCSKRRCIEHVYLIRIYMSYQQHFCLKWCEMKCTRQFSVFAFVWGSGFFLGGGRIPPPPPRPLFCLLIVVVAVLLISLKVVVTIETRRSKDMKMYGSFQWAHKCFIRQAKFILQDSILYIVFDTSFERSSFWIGSTVVMQKRDKIHLWRWEQREFTSSLSFMPTPLFFAPLSLSIPPPPYPPCFPPPPTAKRHVGNLQQAFWMQILLESQTMFEINFGTKTTADGINTLGLS